MLMSFWTDLTILPELIHNHYHRHHVFDYNSTETEEGVWTSDYEVIIYVMVICCCYLLQINLLGFSVKDLLCGTEKLNTNIIWFVSLGLI